MTGMGKEIGAGAGITKDNGNRPVTLGRTGTDKGRETGTGRNRGNDNAPLASGANGTGSEGGSKLGSTGYTLWLKGKLEMVKKYDQIEPTQKQIM